MDEPFIKFYVSDHLGDAGLRSCGAAARGVWADMKCLMHQGTPYGHLADAKAKTIEPALARLIALPHLIVNEAVKELEAKGVFSRNAAGLIYSRRMVRDERKRKSKSHRNDRYRQEHTQQFAPRKPRAETDHQQILDMANQAATEEPK